MIASYDPALPLYFQHIPKTAGTSVAQLVVAAFNEEDVCPVWHWDTIARCDDMDLARYRLFVGHYSSYLPRYLGKPLNTFTFMRDPVERTISHYEFVRRDVTHPYYSQTAKLSLKGFVLAPETRANVENYQARDIADLGINPRQWIEDYADSDTSAYPFQKRIEEESLRASRYDLRAAALEGLDRYFLVATVDDLESCIAPLSRTMERPLGTLPRINITPNRVRREDLDDATLEAIQEATQIDQALYDEVKRRSALRSG